MRYYILPDANGFKVLKVQDDDIALFQRRYAMHILCEAASLTELLVQFAVVLEKDPSRTG